MNTQLVKKRTVPLQVSWGGGINSTALLIGLQDLGIRPDVILFADTQGEKPETYFYQRNVLPRWLERAGFPALTIVAKATPDRPTTKAGYTSLEDEALKTATLPSRAFGFGRCADKWKIQPQHRYMRKHFAHVWEEGKKVIKALGYDAGEPHRAARLEDDHYLFWHPLIEWGWDRAGCVTAIKRAGLPVPPKSACFFCPSSTKTEILELEKTHPELLARAEEAAEEVPPQEDEEAQPLSSGAP